MARVSREGREQKKLKQPDEKDTKTSEKRSRPYLGRIKIKIFVVYCRCSRDHVYSGFLVLLVLLLSSCLDLIFLLKVGSKMFMLYILFRLLLGLR